MTESHDEAGTVGPTGFAGGRSRAPSSATCPRQVNTSRRRRPSPSATRNGISPSSGSLPGPVGHGGHVQDRERERLGREQPEEDQPGRPVRAANGHCLLPAAQAVRGRWKVSTRTTAETWGTGALGSATTGSGPRKSVRPTRLPARSAYRWRQEMIKKNKAEKEARAKAQILQMQSQRGKARRG